MKYIWWCIFTIINPLLFTNVSSLCDSRSGRPRQCHLQIVCLKRLNLLSLSGAGWAVRRWKGKKKDVLICSVGRWVRKSRNDFKLKAFNQIEISFPICVYEVWQGVIILFKPWIHWCLFLFSKNRWKMVKNNNNSKCSVVNAVYLSHNHQT